MNIWDKNLERKGMKVKINFTRPERVKDCHRKKYQLDMDKNVKRMAMRNKKDHIEKIWLRKQKWLQQEYA